MAIRREMADSTANAGLKRAVGAICMVALIALVPACRQSELTGAPEPMETSSSTSVLQYQAPEAAPPWALLNGELLAPASSIWRINGVLGQQRASAEADIPLNKAPASGAWRFTLSSSRAPMTVDVRAFDSLGADGIPTSNVPDREWSCRTAEEPCKVETKSTGTEIALPGNLVQTAGIYVLEVTYPTQEQNDVQAGTNHYSASWAIRVGK